MNRSDDPTSLALEAPSFRAGDLHSLLAWFDDRSRNYICGDGMINEEADNNERIFLEDCRKVLEEWKREQPVKVPQYERGD